jgi:hypothetical protein
MSIPPIAFVFCKKKAQALDAPGLGVSVFRKRLHDKTSRNTTTPSPWTHSASGLSGFGRLEYVLFHGSHFTISDI